MLISYFFLVYFFSINLSVAKDNIEGIFTDIKILDKISLAPQVICKDITVPLDATGNVTWVAPSTIASGTLDQAYDFGGPGLGKTITADAGAVLISGWDGLVSTGNVGTGALMPSSSSSTRWA